MKIESIQIIDRGRGPQLSTSRITVQDLVPYILDKSTRAEIREAMPTLSEEEIQVIEGYIHDHYAEVMEQDCRIRERAAARLKPVEVEEKEGKKRRARLETARHSIAQKSRERNGD